jgi:hypothetical protein
MPDVLLRRILKYLGPAVLMLLSGVSRQMRSVAEVDEVWVQFLSARRIRPMDGTQIRPMDGTRIPMIAKTQFLKGLDVHEWAMTDPYPLNNTFVRHFVDNIECHELRSVMADTMRLCPKRLVVMRLFRRGIMSICDMNRLWNIGGRMRKLVIYLMQRHGCADKVLDCLEAGIVSFTDLQRLYSSNSNFVHAIFAADYRGKYFMLSCVSDLQDGRVTLLQLQNLYQDGDPYRTYPKSATGRSTCSRHCKSTACGRGAAVTVREHTRYAHRMAHPSELQVHHDGGFYARYPYMHRLSENQLRRERAHSMDCAIRARRLQTSYRAEEIERMCVKLDEIDPL